MPNLEMAERIPRRPVPLVEEKPETPWL
jgi:hypothetical protein